MDINFHVLFIVHNHGCFITTHPRLDGHFTSIKTKVGVQISRRDLHTYILRLD